MYTRYMTNTNESDYNDRAFNSNLPVTFDNHMKFSEFDGNDEDAMPCVCWTAGYDGRGSIDQYQHESEYFNGMESRYEYDNDI